MMPEEAILSWFGEEWIDTDARALGVYITLLNVTIQGAIQHQYPCAV